MKSSVRKISLCSKILFDVICVNVFIYIFSDASLVTYVNNIDILLEFTTEVHLAHTVMIV
jgi:hypothetical protein